MKWLEWLKDLMDSEGMALVMIIVCLSFIFLIWALTIASVVEGMFK